MPRPSPDSHALDVAVVHGCTSSFEGETYLPAGHRLGRILSRHAQELDWVIVTHNSVPVGLAAYKRADSDVRVVHELQVDQTLPATEATRVTDTLIVALEMLAYDEGVDNLMFLIHGDVVTAPFQAHGYGVLVAGPCGAWVQKRLGGLTWTRNPSGRPN